MIFIDNKYTNCYYKIINKAKSRISCGYTENHHIIPDCFFKNSTRKHNAVDGIDGDPDSKYNLVLLSAREHFICHLLLTKMLYGKKRSQMSFAFWSMCNRSHTSEENIYKCNSRIYSLSRKLCAIASSELHTGKFVSQETREKISKARTGTKSSEETKKKISDAGKNRRHTKETREKISKSNKGKKSWTEGKHHTEETKKKISAGNKGKTKLPLSVETKKKISDAGKGAVQSEEHIAKRLKSRQENGYYRDRESTIEKISLAAQNRPKYECHCGKLASPSNFKRWHGDNCKFTVPTQKPDCT